VDDRGQLLR